MNVFAKTELILVIWFKWNKIFICSVVVHLNEKQKHIYTDKAQAKLIKSRDTALPLILNILLQL